MWTKDGFTLNLGAVGADEPKLPRWECNYNVLRFLTSCVWVMGCNLNNLSLSYRERAALCAYSISQSLFMLAWKGRRVVIVRGHAILKPNAVLPQMRLLLAFARIHLICILYCTTDFIIMETCRCRSINLTRENIYSQQFKATCELFFLLWRSYCILQSLCVLFFLNTDLETVSHVRWHKAKTKQRDHLKAVATTPFSKRCDIVLSQQLCWTLNLKHTSNSASQ